MAEDTIFNNLAAQDPEVLTTDGSKKETLTIDEAVDRAVNKVTIKLAITLFLISFFSVNAGFGPYLTVFTGYIPYNEWKCLSESTKCLELEKKAKPSDDFYSEQTVCKNDLVVGKDFEWTYKRQTFSMDWGFYCKEEAKLSLVSSVIFLGMLLGLLCSTAMLDKVGRKRGAMIGSCLNLAAIAISAAAPNYIILLLLRIIYGFGLIITYTGSYCWVIELAPQRFRNVTSNIFTMGAWTTGELMLITISYLTYQWKHVHLIVAGISALSLLLFFVLPVPGSPRFSLIQGNKEEALKTLEKMAKLSGNEVSFDKVDLIYEERKQSYLEQIKDFKPHPTMRKETLLLISVWFIVALVSYSYQFGWSKIGNELHSIYLFVVLGKAIAFVSTVPICRLFGRRKALLFTFLWVIVMNAIASLDVKFNDDWSLEHLASMLGSIGTTVAFMLTYLLTGELAPTSHRGMIICLCSSFARVGSFVGPYVNLLYGVTDRRVPLALFAGLSFLASVVVWFLPDTTGRSVPETPGDVEVLAGKGDKTESKN